MAALKEEVFSTCEVCREQYRKARGDQRYCSKLCSQRGNNRKTYQKHRDKMNAKRKQRYLANREAVIQKSRQWRQENLETARERDRESYRQNREKKLAQIRRYREKNPRTKEQRSAAYQAARQATPWKALLRNARRRAEKKKVPFDLDMAWMERNWTGVCAITKLPFALGGGVAMPYSPSVDRIDPKRGYVQANCRFVLMAVNSMMNGGSETDLVVIAEAILKELRKT